MRELRLPRVGGDGDIHLLHGMGGSGKTAVAYTLFQESVGNGRIGLWVNASDRMTLRAGMLAVAADRGAETGELVAAHSGQRAAADLVWHYLDHSAQPWLLVIDNADDPAILDEGGWLRASPMGTVLVTSRHATSPLWRSAVRHKIDVLPLEDAAQVLCDFAPDAGSHREAEQVARTLGCLPLALTLAGSYLAHQLLESWTMSEYDERLHEESTDLIDQGPHQAPPRGDTVNWSAAPGRSPWTPLPSADSRRSPPCCDCFPAGGRSRCPSPSWPAPPWTTPASTMQIPPLTALNLNRPYAPSWTTPCPASSRFLGEKVPSPLAVSSPTASCSTAWPPPRRPSSNRG